MYLPNRKNAVIPKDKITNYLLSTSHPVGKHKAAYFTNIGFEIIKPEVLIHSLKQIAEESTVTETIKTDFGTKYVIDGNIYAPNQRSYLLRTVWMIENNSDTAYLVTAYPLQLVN
ncbi:MAG: hypothetical protein RIG62_13325 [Cyclobacteriaceae bacterium]